MPLRENFQISLVDGATINNKENSSKKWRQPKGNLKKVIYILARAIFSIFRNSFSTPTRFLIIQILCFSHSNLRKQSAEKEQDSFYLNQSLP
jgi:hypothetical protein